MSTAPKVFALGATGYIGGDALYAVIASHPYLDLTCLVRNSDKGAQVSSQFPQVRLVYGDLDSIDVIEAEAKKADLVFNFANADHIGAVNAIIRGLSTRVSKEAGYLIHTSGDSILKYPDIERHSFGEAATKVFDDIADIEEIRSFPDYAPHRPVEKIVFAAHESNGTTLHSAIVCPPTIVGEGRGPGNRQSIQLPLLARIALDRKRALYVGPGEAYLTSVHVSDLSNLFLRLFDAVAARPGSVTWDKEGYYFANAEEHRWGEVSKHIAMEAHQQGLIPTQDVASIPVEEANHIHSMGAELLGGNSRQIASRARKLLGWSPIGPSLVDTIPELITGEAKSLGLIRGHAAKLTRDQ